MNLRKVLVLMVMGLICQIVVASQEPTRASRHALIIGVGTYEDARITPLHGVVHDIANARQMAEQMGVPQQNIRVLQDRDASAARIRAELRDLAARTRDGDRVFLYYSGHGARFAPAQSPGACREALVPWDASLARRGNLLSQEEIAAELDAVYAKADKVFVFIDACHSGGVRTTRTVVAADTDQQWSPKFTPLGSGDDCRMASNVRTRSVQDTARQKGAPARNVVQFSSSRPDEVSLDSPQFGGLATSSWRYCSTYAEDADSSGSLSVQEIATCTQRRIDEKLSANPRYSGQHVVVTGNADFAPALFTPETGRTASTSGSTSGSGAPSMTPAPAPTPETRPVAALPGSASSVTVPTGSKGPRLFPLESVIAQSDERHVVTVQHPSTPLRIGRDFFDLTVSSNRGGYVYLILQSSDNESTYVLFPNGLDQANRIRPGERLQLPRPAWRLQSQGPAGRNRLLVMVTDAPRDLSLLRTSPQGPFVKTLADMAAARSLSWVIGSAKPTASGQCATQLGSKDLHYVDECSDSFGATIAEFFER